MRIFGMLKIAGQWPLVLLIAGSRGHEPGRAGSGRAGPGQGSKGHMPWVGASGERALGFLELLHPG